MLSEMEVAVAVAGALGDEEAFASVERRAFPCAKLDGIVIAILITLGDEKD